MSFLSDEIRNTNQQPLCVECGQKADCIHHILPISDGGEDIASNREPRCFFCHHKVHATRADWVRWGRNGGKKTASNPANFKRNLYQYWSKERKEAHRLAKLEAIPF